MTTTTHNTTESPAALVAIAKAAREAGDRDLERSAKERLSELFGITLSFRNKRPRASEREGGQ